MREKASAAISAPTGEMRAQRGRLSTQCGIIPMARYHYQTRRDAERKYPHRVDIPVPEGGLGKQLNDMVEWCGGRFAEWTFHGIIDDNRRDARGIPMDFARFYFMDEIAAQQFRERWESR